MPGRVAAALLVAAALIGLTPGTAGAHASLVQSNPQPNAVLEEPPGQLHLLFTEAINPDLSAVELTVDGVPVEGVTVGADPADANGLVVHMPPGAGPGVVIVRWRVLSSADGHLTQGIVVYGVGAGADPTSAEFEVPVTGIDPLDAVGRWLNLSAILVLLGAVAATGSLQALPDELRRRAPRLAQGAGVGALAVAVYGVVAQVVTITSAADGVPLGSTIVELLFGSRWGLLWWGRLFGLVGLTAAAWLARRDPEVRRQPSWRLVAIVSGLLVIVAQVAGSHSAGLADHRQLVLVVEALHLGAAVVWVGGLVALLFVAVPRLRHGEGDALVRLYQRFSGPALVAAAVVVGTGLIITGRHATSFDAVLDTSWGRWLLVKVAAVAVVAAWGARNSAAVGVGRELVGRLPSGWAVAERLRSLRELSATALRLEVAAVAVVALGAGMISAAPTANGPEQAPASELGPDTRSGESGDVLVGLSVKPNRPGQNLVAVQAASTRRPAPGEIAKVLVRAEYSGDDRPLQTLELASIGAERWELLDPALSSPGPWTLEVVVRRVDLADQVVTFDWVVPAVAPRDRIVSDARWGRPLTLIGLAMLGATVVGATVVGLRTRRSGS